MQTPLHNMGVNLYCYYVFPVAYTLAWFNFKGYIHRLIQLAHHEYEGVGKFLLLRICLHLTLSMTR
jgi:hypothetical protein